MTQETIRIIEEARKLSDSEWACLKAKLLQKSEEELEKKVCNILNEIGISSNSKGYQYLKTAIVLTYNDPTLLDSVTKVLYPKVAEEFNTTWIRVERSMRYVIEIAFFTGNINKIHEVFKSTYSLEKGKTTNSQFIAGIVFYIRNS